MTDSESVEELTISLDQEPESSLQIYREVFDLCDKDGNGFISKQELSNICEQVSDEDVASSVLDNVMLCLDGDHDGNISFEEFKAGFQAFQQLQSDGTLPLASNSTPQKAGAEEVYESEPVDADESAWREVADRIDPQGTLRGTGVGAVWKEMNRRDPGLLENFEGFLTEIISELKQSDMEKSTLQNHVKRILEQHNKEVNEMDNLLQEELHLAKVTQQQTNASKTSRLSSHYSSLLEEREKVIEQLATHELDLKRALEQKAINESELKQEKTLLLTANRALQEKLETASSHSGQQSEEDTIESRDSSSESDLEEHRAPLQEDTGMVGEGREGEEEREGKSGGEVLSHAMGQQATVVTPPEAGLRLEIVQEDGCTEQEEIKYFPPKKLQSVGSPTHMEDSTVQALVRRQFTPEYQQDSGAVRRTQSPSQPSQQTATSSQAGTTSSQETTGTSVETGSFRHSRGSKRVGGVANTSTSLSIAGVMPRGQTELPSPSPSHLVNRVFKVIFLGESGVGKSSLIAFLTDGYFRTNINSTVGLDYSIKTLSVGDERVVFQLWDTAGQERFNNALTPVYFRRADAFVIVYDVTDVSTFKATKKWVSVIKAALREQPLVIMLVGNKSDKLQQRCVTSEDGRKLALELQAMFSETSALSGDNVVQAHSTLAQLLLARENADLQQMKKAPLDPEKSKCGC